MVQRAANLHNDGEKREDSVMARPPKKLRTSLVLPEDHHTQLAALAAANDVSVAWVIRHAVGEFLKEHNEEPSLPLRFPRQQQGTKENAGEGRR